MPVLPWPLAAIDFEASSLEWDGYPIEVGIVVWRAPDASMLGWSTLIQPPLAWHEGGHWSRASERLHGIGRHMLNEGLSPARVARMVNAMLGPVEVAWCDGQSFDAQWSKTLFDAAGCRAAFDLRDSGVLLHDLGLSGRTRAAAGPGSPYRHRARADAHQLLTDLAVAAGQQPGMMADFDPAALES